MADQLQLRRGTASQMITFTGAQGECVVDTTNNRLIVSDGITAGGWPAAKLSEVLSNTNRIVADANSVLQTIDSVIYYTTLTATRTFTLVAGFPTGTLLVILDALGNVNYNNNGNYITIAAQAGSSIAGAASITMKYPYEGVILIWDGTIWNTISRFSSISDIIRGNRLVTVAMSAAGTISTFGQSVQFTGASPFSVAITSPPAVGLIFYTPTLDLFNASSATITLTTAALFIGPHGNNTNTITMATNTCMYMEWNGANFIIKRL
jgi:hypothetical protein